MLSLVFEKRPTIIDLPNYTNPLQPTLIKLNYKTDDTYKGTTTI